MQQIRFRLVICLRPRWGSLQRSPRPPIAGFEGPYFYGEGRGFTSKERGAEEEGKGEEGKERERKGLKPLQSKFSGYVAAEAGRPEQ